MDVVNLIREYTLLLQKKGKAKFSAIDDLIPVVNKLYSFEKIFCHPSQPNSQTCTITPCQD